MSEAKGACGWGVAGLGWVAGDFIVPAMVEAKGKLVACAGSTPEKSRDFAQRFGFKRPHDDLESLLRDPEVDAVYLALPNAMHHAAVLACARAKKHILCEKPFAMSVVHAREMVAACRDAGVILRIAHQIRLDAAVTRARERSCGRGRLGRLAEMGRSNAARPIPRARRGASTINRAA